jgi:SAM-dependent methyltransferase
MFSQNNNFKVTNNTHGVMHKMNPISKSFVEYAKTCHGTVLDIGSAYGIATIPILQNSTDVKVIACDISRKHLDELSNQARELDEKNGTNLLSRLTCLESKFPYFNLEENSLDAVLASHIFPFLTGKEIEEGFAKLAKFLKPNGILYVTSYSIYNKVMKEYIDTYKSRKEKGDKWPGELEDASQHWDKDNPLTAILPKKLNHLEPCLVESILKENNFKIQYLDFISLTDEIPDDMKLDGREAMGLIASQKKVNI